MKIKLARLLVIFLLCGVGGTWGATRAYAAPRITFDPSSVTVQNGATFQLNVTIDVESSQVLGADAVILYAAEKFDVTGVTNGGFFPDFSWANDPGNDRVEIHAGSFQTFSSKSGSGPLATITFRAKQNEGSGDILFRCGTSAPTSQILNTSGTNILSCGSLNQVAVTFGQSSQPTNTPIPTATPNPTATSAPSGNNNIDPICEGLTANKTSGTAPLTVTFSCTGSDTNNDVNYGEFTFGDGQQLSIDKNVGQKGTISTNHTYTVAGSFGASCRVRDNNSSFSSRPETCKRTITVSAAQSGTTVRATGTPLPTPVPTYGTQIISLSTVTPTPQVKLESPTPAPEEEQKEGMQFPWAAVIVGGLILLGLYGIWIWRSHNNPPNIPPLSPPSTSSL